MGGNIPTNLDIIRGLTTRQSGDPQGVYDHH